jgi:hypothetical protein
MTKRDYSKDAKLKYSEIVDLDTMYGNETGINSSRMRLPSRYDIAKFYKRDTATPSSYDDWGNPRYESGEWEEKEEAQLPKFTDADFDWQITYKFPSTLHNNVVKSTGKHYGGENVTYRRLYLILCEHFNGGDFFVDEYFDSVYPHSWVKEKVDVELHNMQDELTFYASDLLDGAIVTKSGTLDRRYKSSREYEAKIADWEVYAREWEESKGKELAEDIAEDIKKSLENGEIRLNLTLSPATKAKRRQVGLPTDDTVFYAMGDLIDHIHLYVKIGRKGAWKTEQGLLV